MKTYIIDPLKSEIGFFVKHMIISSVKGTFSEFSAKILSSDKNFTKSTIEFECNVDSIKTNVTQRDIFLKSENFFDVQNYPKMLFKSTTIKKEADVYIIDGEFTVKNITKPLRLIGNYIGDNNKKRHTFELSGEINRLDYDLIIENMTGKGSAIVAEEIKLEIHVQLVEQ